MFPNQINIKQKSPQLNSCKLASNEEKRSKNKNKNKKSEREIKSVLNECREVLTKRNSNIPNDSISNLLLNENKRLRNEIQSLESLKEKDGKIIVELDALRKKLKKQSSDHRKHVSSLTSQIESVQKEKNDVSRNYNNLAEDYREAQLEVERLSSEQENLLKQNEDAAEMLKQECKSASKRQNELMIELELFRSKVNDMQVERETALDQHKKDQEQLGGMEEALALVRSEVNESEERYCHLQKETQSLKIKIEDEAELREKLSEKYFICEKTSSQLKSIVDGLQNEKTKNMSTIEEFRKNMEHIKLERDQMKKACVAFETDIACMKRNEDEKIIQLQRELVHLRQEKEEIAAVRDSLEYEMECLKDSHREQVRKSVEQSDKFENDIRNLQSKHQGTVIPDMILI